MFGPMSSARRSTRVSRGIIPIPPKKNRRGQSYNSKRSSRSHNHKKEVRKWVQVMRKPTMNAKYTIPKWVPFDTLTPQELDQYKSTKEEQQQQQQNEEITNDVTLESEKSIMQQTKSKREIATTTEKITTTTSSDPTTPTTNEDLSDNKYNNS